MKILFLSLLFTFSGQVDSIGLDEETMLSGYLLGASSPDNSTYSSENDANSITEYPFTTRMFPIANPKNLTSNNVPSNIKLESEDETIPAVNPRAYNPRPVHAEFHPIPLKEHRTSSESSSSEDHLHRDNNEMVEEHYHFGSYNFIGKRHNHEYHHRRDAPSRGEENEVQIEKPRLPRIIRLNDNEIERQMASWHPISEMDGDVIQQNWWIERGDPSNDTIITYGQMRRRKL